MIKISEKIKHLPKGLTFETHLRALEDPMTSHPGAGEPGIDPSVIFDLGSVMARVRQSRV
jgi:hypothetical protein